MSVITDQLGRALDAESDSVEVPVKITFTTSWTREQFLDQVQRAGSPWQEMPFGKQFSIKYSSLLSVLGLNERSFEGKLRTGTPSDFIRKVSDTITDIQDRGEQRSVSTSWYPPVVRAVAEPAVVQLNQITLIDEDQPIYIET